MPISDLNGDMIKQVFAGPFQQVLAAGAGKEHFIFETTVEFLRIRFPTLVELHEHIGIRSQTASNDGAIIIWSAKVLKVVPCQWPGGKVTYQRRGNWGGAVPPSPSSSDDGWVYLPLLDEQREIVKNLTTCLEPRTFSAYRVTKAHRHHKSDNDDNDGDDGGKDNNGSDDGGDGGGDDGCSYLK